MRRAGVAQLRSGHVGNQVKGGGIHGGAGLLEDARHFAVDLGEQLAGLGRRAAQIHHQGAHHGRHQRRAHVMPHHVANKQTHGRVRKRHHVEEIPADRAGREEEAEKLQIAFRARLVTRHAGEFVRQHGQLQLARHLQFLDGLLVLLFQLPCVLGQFLLGLLKGRNIVGNAESADDFPLFVTPRHLG